MKSEDCSNHSTLPLLSDVLTAFSRVITTKRTTILCLERSATFPLSSKILICGLLTTSIPRQLLQDAKETEEQLALWQHLNPVQTKCKLSGTFPEPIVDEIVQGNDRTSELHWNDLPFKNMVALQHAGVNIFLFWAECSCFTWSAIWVIRVVYICSRRSEVWVTKSDVTSKRKSRGINRLLISSSHMHMTALTNSKIIRSMSENASAFSTSCEKHCDFMKDVDEQFFLQKNSPKWGLYDMSAHI